MAWLERKRGSGSRFPSAPDAPIARPEVIVRASCSLLAVSIIFLSATLTPDLVARRFSPDGQLEAATAADLNLLRGLTGLLGIGLLLTATYERLWNGHLSKVILLVAAGDIGLMVLYVLRAPIFGEDDVVEMATAFLLLASFIVGLRLLWRRARHYPVLVPVAAGLGLLGFLDEISFGARYFGWSMPEMSGGGEFDGAHDFVILTYRLAAEAGSTVVGGGLVTIALVCVLRWREGLHRLAGAITADRAYSAMALFVAGIALASVIDLDTGFLKRLGPLEEIVELNAAAALLATVMIAGYGTPVRRAAGLKADPLE